MFWKAMLPSGSTRNGQEQNSSPLVVSEHGRKGNFFGTLQAYSHAIVEPSAADVDDVDQGIEQIVMFIGSGTRLSPYTQALGNMKSAFPLPDADSGLRSYTVGEAAIRSTAACMESLRHGGFDGLVVRWGDEILIPSTSLSSSPRQYSDVDVVRFGWRIEPSEFLADQKEWLVVDAASGVVLRELSRQSLSSLHNKLAEVGSPGETITYVNLGSFAASNTFLRELSSVFRDKLYDDRAAANWNPYFWVAFQCSSLEDWESFGKEEEAASRSGFRELNDSVPDFFGLVQKAKRNLTDRLGRELRVGILDFGEPYWLDAGNHQSLRSAFMDLFSDTTEGETLRAFLGLPDSLASGGSFIKDCRIAPGTQIDGSIVIGAEIRDPESVVDGALVLRGSYGRLRIHKGGIAIWSAADELSIEGPNGTAFRFSGDGAVSGHSSVSTLISESGAIPMRYDDAIGTIDSDAYSRIVADNPMSFRDASERMASVDPLWLHKAWEQTMSRTADADSDAPVV